MGREAKGGFSLAYVSQTPADLLYSTGGGGGGALGGTGQRGERQELKAGQ